MLACCGYHIVSRLNEVLLVKLVTVAPAFVLDAPFAVDSKAMMTAMGVFLGHALQY